jgi:hypothetical protein
MIRLTDHRASSAVPAKKANWAADGIIRAIVQRIEMSPEYGDRTLFTRAITRGAELIVVTLSRV